jgi:serine/threonine protein kinase/tetratricopeptide (TPR) repeat protein
MAAQKTPIASILKTAMSIHSEPQISLENERRIDVICQAFEDAWARARGPSIAAFLGQGDSDWQDLLLVELLRVDVELRQKAEQPCDTDVYHRELPEFTDRIDAFFAGSLCRAGRIRKSASGESLPAAQSDAFELPKDKESCRNLIFGIVATQLSLISSEQLLAAINSWMQRRDQKISEILCEFGVLSDRFVAILQPLVDAHIQHHGGDPEKSLAALQQSGFVLRGFSADGNTELTASLNRGSTEGQRHSSSIRQSVRPASWSPRQERFQILRFHARGGLGQVAVALDRELHREVALKEIRPELADDKAFRTRFIQEAEINGGLEHPSIVPVYSLGAHPNGRPYYAMRFIKGESLKQSSERFHDTSHTETSAWDGNVEFRKLLGQMIDVCHAIAYAHSRRVLHRDLKPSNIMLGRYGETLVVDWGLAKAEGQQSTDGQISELTLRPASGSDVEPTIAGSRVGTLPYMSPEQARGDLAIIGPASDIYSLGATLYHVLTGRAPIISSDGNLEERAKSGVFTPPRIVNPRIPRPLESICLKAMARAPHVRYASATDLAEDLERWLSDETVLAHRETHLEYSGRWLRRHRSVALTAGASLLVIAVVSLACAATVSVFWNQAEAARHKELAAKTLAQNIYIQAREVVDRTTVELSHVVRNAPGAIPMGDRLLDDLLQTYDELAQCQTSEHSLELLRGKAWIGMGDVYRIRSDLAAADRNFQLAEEHFERLMSRFPEEKNQSSIELGRAHNRRGSVAAAHGQFDEALASWKATIDQLQPQLTASTNDHERRSVLATAYLSVAEVRLDMREFDASQEGIDSVMRTVPWPLDERSAGDSGIENRLSHLRLSALQLRARSQAARGMWRQADQVLPEAVELAELLAQRNSDDPTFLSLPAALQIDRAVVLRALRRPDEELNAYDRALRDYRDLVARFPDWIVNRPHTGGRDQESLVLEALALTLVDRAQLQLELQQIRPAQTDLIEAIPLLSQLSAQYPEATHHREELAAALEAQGRVLHLRARDDEAVRYFEKTLDILSDLVMDWPTVVDYQQRLSLARSLLAQSLAAQDDHDRSDETFRQALEELQSIQDKTAAVPLVASQIAHLQERWGLALWNRNDWPTAEQHYVTALEQWKLTIQNWPNPEYSLAYADLLVSCPVVPLQNPDLAVEIARQVIEQAPQDPIAKAVLAAALYRAEKPTESLVIVSDEASSLHPLARNYFLKSLCLSDRDPVQAHSAFDLGRLLHRDCLGDPATTRWANEAAAALGLPLSRD